jgi:hypothetical protein
VGDRAFVGVTAVGDRAKSDYPVEIFQDLSSRLGRRSRHHGYQKEGSTMNVQAIDPNRAAVTTQAAAASAPAKKAAPSAGAVHAQAPSAPKTAPAATVQMTQVPASVAADDRSTYLQILKANGGNVAAALAAIAAIEAKENNG